MKVTYDNECQVVEYSNGDKAWWIDGRRHRLDGLAIEWADGRKFWYINGINYQEQYFPFAVIMFLLNCDEETTEIILEQIKAEYVKI